MTFSKKKIHWNVVRILQIQVKSWSNFISHPSLHTTSFMSYFTFYIVILADDYIILNYDNDNRDSTLFLSSEIQ